MLIHSHFSPLCKTPCWMERADHLFHPSGPGVAVWCPWGFPFYSLPTESQVAGTIPHPCKGICFRMLTVQGLQRSIWAVRTAGKLPKSRRSPSIPQEISESTAAKHMSLPHELGDHSHTTAAVHSSICLFNSALSLSISVYFFLSVFLSFLLPVALLSFQGSHILSKPHGKFVCGEYLGRCNHRGLSAGQMFRVSMQARLNSMPRRLCLSAVP